MFNRILFVFFLLFQVSKVYSSDTLAFEFQYSDYRHGMKTNDPLISFKRTFDKKNIRFNTIFYYKERKCYLGILLVNKKFTYTGTQILDAKGAFNFFEINGGLIKDLMLNRKQLSFRMGGSIGSLLSVKEDFKPVETDYYKEDFTAKGKKYLNLGIKPEVHLNFLLGKHFKFGVFLGYNYNILGNMLEFKHVYNEKLNNYSEVKTITGVSSKNYSGNSAN